MIRVSAGVIYGTDGRILIAKRGEGRKNAHLWEFPGGKQETGESAAEALRRELQQELSLVITEPRMLFSNTAQGLAFDFLAAEALNEPKRSEHEALAWVMPSEMLSYDFCPADVEASRRIALRSIGLRAYLWDLDGTLLNTYPNMTDCLQQAVSEAGVVAEKEELLALMKVNLRYAVDTIAERNELDPQRIIRRFRELQNASPLEKVTPMPGVPQALRRLQEKGGRHFLITHRDSRAWEYLRVNGLLEYFSGGVTAQDGFPRKPAPDSIRHILQTYDIRAEKAVMIGDRPLDMGAGRAAGVLTCLVDGENRFQNEPCSLRAVDCIGLEDLLCPDE